MPACNFISGIDDLLASQFENNGFVSGFTHLALKLFFQLLTFLDDGVHLLCNTFIIALLEQGLLMLKFSYLVVALGLDLGYAGIDAGSLLAFRNRDLILETLHGFLAGFLIHIGNNILREIQNPVQVATRNIK